jgi:hypothetical protein
MPAHDEWLTLAIATALLVTLHAGFASWWSARAWLRRPWLHENPWSRWWRRPLAALVLILVLAISWLRTEAGFDHHALRLVDAYDDFRDKTSLQGCALRDGHRRQATGHPHPDCLVEMTPEERKETRLARADRIPKLRWFTLTSENPIADLWLDGDETWTPLARTDLSGEELVDLPADWRSPETARHAFRKTWCDREGLPMPVCGHPVSANRPAPASQRTDRAAWCTQHGLEADDACFGFFDDLETRFTAAWDEERDASQGNLAVLDLSRRDLRCALGTGDSLYGADLSQARM